MFDLHVHSVCSDGTLTPSEVVREAKRRGLTGLSLVDHNGVWGTQEARETAQAEGLHYIQGIEISTSFRGTDVHILGYSRHFDAVVLTDGLASTRAGYETRIKHMVERCQQAGYTDVSWDAIVAKRAHLTNPSYVTYDLTEQLQKNGLPAEEARQLTVRGGICYVPYSDDWAMSPMAAIELITKAKGIAVLAHPGVVAHEAGQEQLLHLLSELHTSQLTGLEVWHPFHTEDMITEYTGLAEKDGLIKTAGSDWHGPNRFTDSDLGSYGLSEADFAVFQARLV